MTAEWLAKKLNGKGNIIVMTGVPGTSVDTLRTKAAKEVFAKYPDIKIVGEAVGMWSQAVARTELSKILATRNWDQIDGLWTQVGCYTARADSDQPVSYPQARPGIQVNERRLADVRWRLSVESGAFVTRHASSRQGYRLPEVIQRPTSKPKARARGAIR